MKIFIFGAGASRGAQPDNVHEHAIAPLTDELFNARYQKFASMVGLSEPSMNIYRDSISKAKSLEEWLTNEWSKTESIQEVWSKNAQRGLLAQIAFYIWLVLRNVTSWTYNNSGNSRDSNTYLALMNKLLARQEQFGLINFNYDLLLDFAYKDVYRITFHDLDDYLNRNYVKPHGSINWLLEKREDDRPINLTREYHMDTRVRLDTAINLMFRDAPIPVTGLIVKEPNHRDLYLEIDDLFRVFREQYFYPLIFLPLTAKVYSSISGFEEKILEKGRELMAKATDVYLIGYRANDDLIKDMLSKAPKDTKVHVIGLNSAEGIMNNVLKWAKNLKKGEVSTQGFRRFVYDTTLL